MGKRMKQANMDDFLVNTTDVASLFFDIGRTNKEAKDKLANKTRSKRKDFSWVYNNLKNYGNVFVSTKTYEKLNKHKLGKHKLEPVKKVHSEGNDGYILWRIK